jgi:hypothetical protein
MDATIAAVDYRYSVGELVSVVIGGRPALTFPVLARVLRPAPHYQLDWTENGFSPLLNAVFIPETSLQPATETL